MPRVHQPPLPEELALVRGYAADVEADYKRSLFVREPVFTGEWADYYEHIRDELAERYASLGPQYRLLCQMVAATWTNIRRAEQEGFKVEMPQYAKAMDLLRKLIDQSQRYTEARKAEVVVREVNSAVRETLLIVETHLQNQPELFRSIVLDVAKRVME